MRKARASTTRMSTDSITSARMVCVPNGKLVKRVAKPLRLIGMARTIAVHIDTVSQALVEAEILLLADLFRRGHDGVNGHARHMIIFPISCRFFKMRPSFSSHFPTMPGLRQSRKILEAAIEPLPLHGLHRARSVPH